MLKRWTGSVSLEQMSLADHVNPKETFLYKLSEHHGLGYFKHVLLFSSPQDLYVPFMSARIQLCDDGSSVDPITKEMCENCNRILRQGKVHVIRVAVDFGQTFELSSALSKEVNSNSNSNRVSSSSDRPVSTDGTGSSGGGGGNGNGNGNGGAGGKVVLDRPEISMRKFMRRVSGLSGSSSLSDDARDGKSHVEKVFVDYSTRKKKLLSHVMDEMGKSIDEWSGRSAHIKFLNDATFIQQLAQRYAHLMGIS